ncbi:MAG TPA: NAD-dependent epimerase/dehydratase family protein [Kiritimatiellia bacterium]|nr:NAD-dependent epimerase/dehydratase family protein [Kiritimatiellia bacterium]
MGILTNELAYKGKKVLVTGGTGTIGVPLVRKLMQLGADVTVVSLDERSRAKKVFGTDEFFRRGDLTKYEVCAQYAKGMDSVFHLVAVKGCTTIGTSKVASAFVPFVLSNTNMMEASFRCGVRRYLFVGSICEYPNLEVRHEDDVWNGPPQANDRYTGIAKRTGEAQAETYLHEYGWDAVRIVRPSNVYGPYDDFDPKTAQVIPALISRMVGGENPVRVSGDGSAERDVIFSEDVAWGMILALEKAPPCVPINLGAGKGYTIKEVAQTIADLVPGNPGIQWDPAAAGGDKKRILDTERAKKLLGFEPQTGLRTGIRKTIDWFLENREMAVGRGRELHG